VLRDRVDVRGGDRLIDDEQVRPCRSHADQRINYIDRATLAVANLLIRQDLGLSIADMGYLLSAFLWADRSADRLVRAGAGRGCTPARTSIASAARWIDFTRGVAFNASNIVISSS
jgi:hypothetical protein